MSHFSHLIMSVIANQMVLPWDSHQDPLQSTHLFVILKNSGFLITHNIFALTFIRDIFVTFNSHEQVKQFVEYMNIKHPNIKFTFEHEHNNTVSSLDLKICHENNKLTTSVCRKPTFSGVFTNFKSFIPKVKKFGLET